MLDRSFIRQSAAAAGFDLCGVAPCRHLVRNEQFFRRWLGDGRHASLGYLERNLDKRFDVRRLSRRGADGSRLRRRLQERPERRLSRRLPREDRLVCPDRRLPCHDQGDAGRPLSGVFVPRSLPSPAGRSSIRPARGKQLAVEAGWAGSAGSRRSSRPGSIVRPAGRAGARRGLRSLRRAARRRGVRLLPPPRRSLPDRCRLQRPRDRCAPPHLLSYDRTDAGCGNCPRRVDFRLRRLPEPLPLQPPCAAHLHPAFDPLFDPLSFPPERWLAMEEAEFRTSFGRTPLMRGSLRRLQANAAQNLRRKG